MGINKMSSEFLAYVQKRFGVEFGRTLTLGRLQMYTSPDEVQRLTRTMGVPWDARKQWKMETGHCEPFLSGMGAVQVDSIDASDYEGATIVHDLNIPTPAEHDGKYDCVIDGGTIEHVFHFPNAIQSCMRMISSGGYYIGITPANNQMGHGFYQFSPELYFRLFTPENGFEMLVMLMHTGKEWFEVTDPKIAGRRGDPLSSVPLFLAFVARKTTKDATFHTPQQSDYVDAWEKIHSIQIGAPREGESALGHAARRYIPRPVKTFLRNLKDGTRKKIDVEGLTDVDPALFHRIDLTVKE